MSVSPSLLADPKLRDIVAYAKRYLRDIHRNSKESYALHCLEVANVLREVAADAPLVRIAALHDLLVHPEGKLLLQASPLKSDERSMVKRMHELRKLHIDENTDDLDMVIGAFTDDPRLMILRMAHRLNDVRHLKRFAKTRRRELAHETLHMYAAIAERLGFHRWRWQMEDICFLELQPDVARTIQRQFTSCRRIDQACLSHAGEYLSKKMQDHCLDAKIDTRIKGVYSTYRKMVIKKYRFDELTDRLALRILVPSVDDCYRALGIVHASMHAMPGKLKDYIGIPKDNGYRSIHTVVYPLPGVTQLPIEIQIRTKKMHEECEYGVASHASYKDLSYALGSGTSRVNLFRNLESLRSMAKTPAQFEKVLRTYFREDDILVFDPQNHFYHIRKPATALDLACQQWDIDPKSIRGVRINGRQRDLGTLLHDGDTVEMLTGERPLAFSTYIKSCQKKQTAKLLRELWHRQGGDLKKAAPAEGNRRER
ncbi:MAG TPA: HD domain-containing protein [Candidatus Peribacteraceae bacterium]|nr:HD domain-containing protein [Candidatus Peribacteraceae bacterium]